MNATNRAEVIPAGDVLVIDDTLDNLRLLMNILTAAGFHARPAGNGELALRSARAKRPALILLDIKMPEVDGFEVCRRLKADESTRDVPVIFLSGLADTADKSKGFSLGAVDYITKPFQAEEVLARVRAHLALAAAREQLATRNLQLQSANEQLSSEIAERMRAEVALRDSKERLEKIYRSVGEGIVSIDGEQRIVLFNAAAETIFGYSAAEMLGRPITALLPERFRAQHDSHIRRFDAEGQSNRAMGAYGLIYGLRANGEEFPIEATVSQSGVSPTKLFTVLLRDITERRQAERMREQLTRQLELLSERLASAQEQERRKIAYDLQEDVGQQLMALRFYLQMMEPDSGKETKNPKNEALAVVFQAMQRIRDLLLDLTPPELEDFGLHSAVPTYCERQAGAGGWNLHVDAPKPEVRPPRSVERACFRVLQDGLASVLHHTKATELWVQVRQDADHLELVIRDNGVGLDRNAARDDSRREGGSLELFGMQVRARQVGGSVEIKSALDGCTEIRALFPLGGAAAVSA